MWPLYHGVWSISYSRMFCFEYHNKRLRVRNMLSLITWLSHLWIRESCYKRNVLNWVSFSKFLNRGLDGIGCTQKPIIWTLSCQVMYKIGIHTVIRCPIPVWESTGSFKFEGLTYGCLTLMLLANTKWGKRPENDWNPGTWVIIWAYSLRAIQLIPTSLGLGDLSKTVAFLCFRRK